LVLITNSLLDFHIRTTNFTGWAGITAVGIKIGASKLEIYEPAGSIFVNGADVTASPPATFGGYTFTVVAGPSGTFRIDLAGGQYILVTRTYLNTLQVDVLGHGSDFGNSQGLCANWTANSPNALRGRDGTTLYSLSMPIPYGEHWKVNSTLGDPTIFTSPSAAKCLYTTGECTNPQTGGTRCQEQQIKAVEACKNVVTERNARTNCEFDVRVTGDTNFATTTAYTNPIIGEPEERCVQVVANVTANVTSFAAATAPEGNCTKSGGQCVWRCDKAKFNCIDQYCKGPDQGCSCAIPIPPVPTPVTKPAPTPVAKPAPTLATPPVAEPVKTPVQPPTRRFCLFFGLFCFDICGFIGKLFGLCRL
jgi:hypothetical protein